MQTPETPHSTRKPCRLTIRSTGQFAACRLWASFHSRPTAACRKMPVSSNVRLHSKSKVAAGSSLNANARLRNSSVLEAKCKERPRTLALFAEKQTAKAVGGRCSKNGASVGCCRLAAGQTALLTCPVPSKPNSNCALRSGPKYRNPTSRSHYAVASNGSSVQTSATPHSTRKPCRLTIRSTGHFAACRVWAKKS